MLLKDGRLTDSVDLRTLSLPANGTHHTYSHPIFAPLELRDSDDNDTRRTATSEYLTQAKIIMSKLC